MLKFLLFLLGLPLISFSQNQYTLSGYVRDASNGEELIGVNIVIPAINAGTSTNVYGYYSLSIPEGSYQVEFQYIGYQTLIREIELRENITLTLELPPSTTELQEVEVNSERLDKNVTSVEMSVARLDAREIQKIPQLLGETDIIRTLTLLPGITTVGEGANGFNVRGGAADQNLILLDEAPVYNSSHLFGFFSIFNADAVKDVKLYKGGIPAQYGGRLSSVVDVRQKEGNSKNFGFNGGIGLLSSRLLLEGPIVKDKMSFMVAGRRSYADIFTSLSSDPDISSAILYFYDLNAKINYRLSEKDRLYLSGYFGRDVFGLQNLFGFDWGNATTSLRWNHLFSEKLFSNFTAVYSDYQYTIGTNNEDNENSEEQLDFQLKSRIRDYHLKGAFNYYLNEKNQLDFGFEAIYYEFDPGRFTGFANITLAREYAVEPSVYISHELNLNQRLKIQYGLRYSSFYNIGEQTVLSYADPAYPEKDEVVDSTHYGPGQIIAGYNGLSGLEPRLSVNYLLDEARSIKASYNRTRQYIHLISNTTSPTPVDLYRPAGRYLEPATVNQYAVGYFQNLRDDLYEASIEIYYKDFANLVDYRSGAQLIFNEFIETEVLTGKGRAYGLEVLLRKRRGKLTGWFSYTLSRAEQKVSSPNPRDAVSNGDWYASNHNKLHDASLVLNYQLTKKWDVSTTLVFQSGRPITLPVGRGQIEDIVFPIYTERNNGNIPAYHRMDLSANFTPERNPEKRFYSSWNFGIYNVYGRRNAYSIYFENVPADEQGAEINSLSTRAMRLSIFGTLVPFATWNFNF